MLVLDKNNFEGDADAVCGDGNRPANLNYFVADCEQPELDCGCCTKCCSDSDAQCNPLEMPANIDGGYSRDKYVFSEDLVFSASDGDNRQ